MAFTFAAKLKGAAAPPPVSTTSETAAATETAPKPGGLKISFKPAQAKPAANGNGAAPQSSGNKPGWMKTGQAAKAAVQHADAMAEKAKEEAGKMFRFWMPVDSERTITFLDGGVDAEGMLDVPMWNEHRLKMNGDWTTFVCTADQEPCPICEAADSKTSLVGVMTVLDHTAYKIQRGPNAGKVIQHNRKLFVCTRQTLKLLAKQAVKLGGLRGCTFDVQRTGDKEPGVGNQFIFQGKNDLAALAKECGIKIEETQPADYSEEIVYRPAEELLALGVGKALNGIGNEKAVSTSSLKNEL